MLLQHGHIHAVQVVIIIIYDSFQPAKQQLM